MRKILLLLLLTLVPALAQAQTTTVTGTVVDPNGNAYFPGTVSAAIILNSGQPIPAGVPASGSIGPFATTSGGNFSVTVASPFTWTFTICGTPVNIGPRANPTPTQVCFSTLPIAISGASQVITSSLGTIPNLGPNVNSIPGNAATATALQNAPAQCAASSIATGITANGTANCTNSPSVVGLTVSGTGTFTGTLTACLTNGMYTAGSSCYPTIQSAINTASASSNCSFTTNCGTVLIPPKYAGTDTFTNVNLNVLVIDQRSNLFNAPHMNLPTFVTTADSDGTYPAGRDMNFFPMGPAGMYFRRSTVNATTTASLIVGANTNVLISSINNHNVDLGNVQTGTALTLFSIGTGIAPQKLSIGRQTANNEQLTYNATANCPTAGTWNIVDGTHLCLNTTKTHAGTTDIEQPPDPVRFDFTDWQIRSYQARPSQDSTTCLTAFINDFNGINEFTLPSDTTCAAPRNLMSYLTGFNIIVGGGVGSASPVPTTWEAFTLGGPNFSMTNLDQGGTARGFVGPFYGGTTNNAANANFPIRLQNNTFAGWRNAANSDDDVIGFNASDQLEIVRGFSGGTAQLNLILQNGLVNLTAPAGGTTDTIVARATIDSLSNKTLNIPLVSGTGLQIFNTTTTCTTAASVGATCTTAAISLPVAEADTSYRVVCTGKGPTAVPVVSSTANSSATQFTITIAALTAVAASFSSYDCVVGHN